MEGDDSDFANFALPVLKASLEARSQNVSGNKEQLAAHAIGCPKTLFFFLSLSLSLHEIAIFWSAKNDAKTLFPFPRIFFASASQF